MESNYLLAVRSNGGIFYDAAAPTTSSSNTFTQQEIHGDDFSLNESVITLQSLWRTEYHSPIVLPYPTELIEEIQDSLKSQQVRTDVFSVSTEFEVPLQDLSHTHTLTHSIFHLHTFSFLHFLLSHSLSLYLSPLHSLSPTHILTSSLTHTLF